MLSLLETGCGTSTLFFALKGTSHTAITPNAQEKEELFKFCAQHAISSEKLQFVLRPSEEVLPSLETAPLDVVIIDGQHGFPTPFLDYFYSARHLKIGGYLVVDDTWLWPCAALKNVLAEEPGWHLEMDFAPRTAIFKKLASGSEVAEWQMQPYVVRNSLLQDVLGDGVLQVPMPPNDPGLRGQARRALGYLRQGEWKTIREKIAGKFKK